MTELFTMWRSTRMVVLTSISAALYAASLIAFKFLSILPGVTEIRPGVAFVVLCSLLFGPAGAWGAAIGNTIGDLAGGLGPGTAVGFVANLLYGWVPYRLYRAFGIDDASPRGPATVRAFVVASVAASAACALVVGAGIQGVGLWPVAFKILVPAITITNSLVCGLLGLLLAREIAPRVAALGLRYQDILGLPPARVTPLRRALAAAALVAIGVAVLVGYGDEWSRWDPDPSALDRLVGIPLALAVILLAVAGRP